MVYAQNTPYTFSPLTTEPVIVGNDTLRGEIMYTEMAKQIAASLGQKGVDDLYPDEQIEARQVKCTHYFEGIGTTLPTVEPGKPDLFLDFDGGQYLEKYYKPLYIRASFSVAYASINYKTRPGTVNERWPAADQIQEKMTKFMVAHALTWRVFRTMMTLGGINFTDPRSGIPTNARAYIPPHNVWSYNQTSGYQGRNEANLFRNLIDSRVAEEATAGVPWTNPDADILNFIRRFKRWFKDTNKSAVTDMYISPELADLISENNELRMFFGGNVLKFGAQAGDTTIYGTNGVGGGNYLPGNTYGNGAVSVVNGDIVSIEGVKIHVVDLEFKDPESGMNRRMWPMDKVVFVSRQDSEGNFEAPGRTQFCISEYVDASPGLWVYAKADHVPPAAPGYLFQVGNAGMPYLKYPYRVAHVKVAELAAIRTRIAIPGDRSFGLI